MIAFNTATTPIAIDSEKVLDNGLDDGGIGDFVDGVNTDYEYTYDANGNMITDLNKGISSAIDYTYMNLPQTVNMGEGRTIDYLYDAVGIKWQKQANDNGQVNTTDYIAGAIYENNKLQHMAHEEGRVRQNDQGALVYDYYIKDHLGNTRVTFTSEPVPVNVYKATMESENDVDGNSIEAHEESLFYNLDQVRSAVVSAANKSTQSDDGCTSCNEAALTNANQRIGPAILLNVMPGDEIDLETWAYHQGVPSGNNTTSTTSLVSALTSAFVPGSNSELVNQMTSVFSGAITDVAGSNGSTTNATQSYLNWVMFDNNFIVVSASSGHVPVSTSSNILHRLHEDNIAIGQKGYFYVWMSNERGDNFNVYFDDLKVTHTKGRSYKKITTIPWVKYNISPLKLCTAIQAQYV